ncbi:kelch domain-containing protein 9 [Latimeria chalumnae]|uniref:kelch domain-containing protein 9 n=1 Tax=Latimeria chalumnae TaxID=7897 RepID=UPI00313C34CC
MSATDVRWEWKPLAQNELFARAFHTCNVIQGKLVLFGGVRTMDPKEAPLGDVVLYDPATGSLEAVASTKLQPRSHHDTVVIQDRWLCVVGGWDGKRRVSSVLCFDMESKEWVDFTEGPSNDPPVGLSSHTCTKVSDYEIQVVGREGGLRMQRRFGSVYCLRVNPRTKTFWYREVPSRTASRAGHSAVLVPDSGTGRSSSGHKLVVFGGRDSMECDIVGHWSKEKIHVESVHAPGLIEQLARLIGSCKATVQPPKSLRHHSCSVVGPFAVVYGGECLKKARDTVCNDLLIYDMRPSATSWHQLPSSNLNQKRVGHRTCLVNDKLYLTGGLGKDGRTPCSEIYVLEISA